MNAWRYRIYGPPGCGKTTWLQTQVKQALGAGMDPTEISVLSFSRAAFREFSARLGDAVPEENLGTLHSMAYRAIGRPPIALSKEVVGTWNQQAPMHWHISPRVRSRTSVVDPLDPYGEATEGDALYDRVVLLRNRLVPLERWPEEELLFWSEWQQFMHEQDVVDFPGMIERAAHTISAPTNPQLLLVDEAQDLSPLQMRLVERWSHAAQQFAIIGDDDQAIYAFQGADGNAFLRMPVNGEIVLHQSYRIPARVQSLAEAISSRISFRVAKEYAPRSALGAVREIREGPESPHYALKDALEQVRQGRRVLFLAPARYMLDPLKTRLLELGLAYGNPYAPHRPEFNLFYHGEGDNIPGWQRARGFVKKSWTGADVKLWVEYLRLEVFAARGQRERFETLADDEPFTPTHPLWQAFTPTAAEALLARDVRWLRTNLLRKAPEGFRRALDVAERNPQVVLRGEAAVWVGTIHSVKGGEADVVYVWPGLTRLALQDEADVLHRMFYVSVTRARHEVVLLDSGASPGSYPWPEPEAVA